MNNVKDQNKRWQQCKSFGLHLHFFFCVCVSHVFTHGLLIYTNEAQTTSTIILFYFLFYQRKVTQFYDCKPIYSLWSNKMITTDFLCQWFYRVYTLSRCWCLYRPLILTYITQAISSQSSQIQVHGGISDNRRVYDILSHLHFIVILCIYMFPITHFVPWPQSLSVSSVSCLWCDFSCSKTITSIHQGSFDYWNVIGLLSKLLKIMWKTLPKNCKMI